MKQSISKELLQPISRSGKKCDIFHHQASHVTPKKSIKVLCQHKNDENSPGHGETTSRINMIGVTNEIYQNEIQ